MTAKQFKAKLIKELDKHTNSLATINKMISPEILKMIRIRSKYSLRSFGAKAGESGQRIFLIEKGKFKATPKILRAYAEIIDEVTEPWDNIK